MCAINHDGTCAAVLSRDTARPGQFVAKLVCESCDEVIRVICCVEHTVTPILAAGVPEALERVA